MDSRPPLPARARWATKTAATAVCASWHRESTSWRRRPPWAVLGEGCAQGQPRPSRALILPPEGLPLPLGSTPFSMSEMGF